MSTLPAVLTVGELLVEFVSHERGCALSRIAEYSGPYPSGAPAIFLDQAARMGIPTLLFGSVGDDGFGRALHQRLRDNGVGTDAVQIHPELTTGTAFVSYYDDGSRDFIFHLRNTAAERVEFSASALPPGRHILHVSASSLGSPPLRSAILQAVDAVLSAGGSICCDPNARPELMRDEDSKRVLDRIIASSTYLMPSTSDLAFLFPDASEEEAIEHLLSAGASIIAIKRGAKGATVVGPDERHDLPGHVVHELDPTGAGDSFCGTLIALLAQEVPLLEAARFANAAGAIAVTRRGPMEGNSSVEEIRHLLAKQDEVGATPRGSN